LEKVKGGKKRNGIRKTESTLNPEQQPLKEGVETPFSGKKALRGKQEETLP